MESNKNKRLAKNTIYLYIRMLFAVCINLYTSRLLLEYLGVEDFGVYNVVGGIVSLMMFVNTAMSGATSRFITFCLGKNDVLELKATISSAIQVHAIIALFILLIGESKLTIKYTYRINVCRKLGISVFSFFFCYCYYTSTI